MSEPSPTAVDSQTLARAASSSLQRVVTGEARGSVLGRETAAGTITIVPEGIDKIVIYALLATLESGRPPLNDEQVKWFVLGAAAQAIATAELRGATD